MISICLKSSRNNSLNLIEKYLDNITFPEIYYSQKKFKNFYNIIIHYKGTNQKKFLKIFSKILSDYIITNYEKKFINNQLNLDFFYFSNKEKNIIKQSAISALCSEQNQNQKYNILQNTVLDYFSDNYICNIDGFVNFRLYRYKDLINTVLENVINDYILQKEYSEYVNLLREYIKMQSPQSEVIHLIYSKDKKLLLDESRNIIANTGNAQVYLSDITFSSNDFILNSLLSLLPKKLHIHLDTEEDNFIIFLKLIFRDKFYICNNCHICSNYFSDIKNRI